MRAMVFEAHGGLDQLKLREVPDPPTAAGHVRVAVKACALNRLDLFVREGWRGLKLSMPHVLGSDVAGVVESVGQGVFGVAVGDAVLLAPGMGCAVCEACLAGRDNRCRTYDLLGETRWGGYAELVTVPARNVFPKPPSLSFEKAACLPLVFTTAWGMLVERAKVRAGEVVLVQAAGSGVGSAAIQIAKLMGAKVIATASADRKLERARELGADHVIHSAREDLSERVRAITEKRGVDVVVEHAGGDAFEASLRSLSVGGRLVTCGATSRPKVEVDIRYVFARHLSILGNTMGSLSAMIPILKHVVEGALTPVWDRTLPLDHAREAQQLLLDRAQFGKIVLSL